MKLVKHQQEGVDASIEWMRKSLEPGLLEYGTGCHEKGHPILMYDGTIKNVEDIKVNDAIMGADGKQRTVLKLHRGVDKMAKVTPTKGESFCVNYGHIFSFLRTPKHKGQNHVEFQSTAEHVISTMGKTEKHRAKLYRCSVDFEEKKQEIDPYVLGCLIGDGCFTQPTVSFCNPDHEINDYLKSYIESIGLRFNYLSNSGTAKTFSITDPNANRSTKSRFKILIENIGLYGKYSHDKFIPRQYKSASKNQRLQILAGLIDTDGSYDGKVYDWISKSEVLADDVVYICRSLGFSAYKSKCKKTCQNNFTGNYFRVCISGDIKEIPCKVERKKAEERIQIKRVDVTGFKIEPYGYGHYYGFEIDGDHLYLDGYFMAHHNSGKSLIIGECAKWLNQTSGKKVLCLAPSKELVVQNRQKYLALGLPASMFSASAGEKSLKHDVVFGTPRTVLNKIKKFGRQFSGVVIDEAHGITPTIKSIIDAMRSENDKLRILGLSATPWRMNTGYIYQYDVEGNPVPEHQTHEPYFNKLLYRCPAPYLIENGYLTAPHADPTHIEGYQAENLKADHTGRFKASEVEQVFEGKGRLTAAIVADVVANSRTCNGVMLFAATVNHAHEIMESLHPDNSRLVIGGTKDRDGIITDFKKRKFKYLVSVGTLTTGFDAPHVDHIAMLRATESAALLEQIMGRGSRLVDPRVFGISDKNDRLRAIANSEKPHFLFSDYAKNIERHYPTGELYKPEIKARKKQKSDFTIEACCPSCGAVNEFSGRENKENFEIDKYGYFVDLAGNRIKTDDDPPLEMPAHYGRRCYGQEIVKGVSHRCEYRWTFKKCVNEECGHENDIAARFCESCKTEIIDPNRVLVLNFQKIKKDPYTMTTDKVLAWRCQLWNSSKGNQTVRVDYQTEFANFPVWYFPSNMSDHQRRWESFCNAVYGEYVESPADFIERIDNFEGAMPQTLTVRKSKTTGLYHVYGHNKEEDVRPNENTKVA